jgi:serine protease inhibitor
MQVDVCVDRPFLLLLVEKQSGMLLLFAGKICHPDPAEAPK